MGKRKPCQRCGRPKPPGRAIRHCGVCSPVDAVWDQLRLGPGDCWIWSGRTTDGYGTSSKYLVHRLTYEALICDIPEGLDLDHLCLVTRCANPWHLEPVTRSENSRRKWAIYTHCKQGHEFTSENTYVDPRGHRNCRACTNESQRRYNMRRKAAIV